MVLIVFECRAAPYEPVALSKCDSVNGGFSLCNNHLLKCLTPTINDPIPISVQRSAERDKCTKDWTYINMVGRHGFAPGSSAISLQPTVPELKRALWNRTTLRRCPFGVSQELLTPTARQLRYSCAQTPTQNEDKTRQRTSPSPRHWRRIGDGNCIITLPPLGATWRSIMNGF